MPRGIPRRNGLNAEPAVGDATVETQPPLSQRATEMRRERRRRDDGDLDRMGRMALSIPQEVKERAAREGKTLRWIRDTPGRVQEMTRDDWDIVQGVDPVAASRHEEGNLVLVEKYQDWFDEDRAKMSRLLDEKERAIERGMTIDPEDKRQQAVSYVPDGNRISRKPGV